MLNVVLKRPIPTKNRQLFLHINDDILGFGWQDMKAAEKRVMKESLGLDPDEDSDLEEEDAVWDPLSEFAEDAVLPLHPGVGVGRCRE